MPGRLPEFQAQSFINFVEFNCTDDEQPWLCYSKGFPQIMFLLFSPHRTSLIWLIPLMEKLQFGAECVLWIFNFPEFALDLSA